LAVVWDVAGVVFGKVIVAVTPPFCVAPLPLTVNWVTPAIPVVGEMVLFSAELPTWITVEPEADKPARDVTVHVTPYPPGADGAVQVALAPLPDIVPPVALHA
jgi:hypothetical protein